MTAQVIMLRSALHSSMTRWPGGCNGLCNEWGRSCYKSHRIKPEILFLRVHKNEATRGNGATRFRAGGGIPG